MPAATSQSKRPELRKPLPSNPPLGLVVEGGGVRALYAAGVLDVLHDLKLPVSGVIGVSAGAIHGVSYVSGQKERSLRIYMRFLRDPRFFSLRTLLRTGSIVDNDFCYREIPAHLERFDEEAFERAGIAFYAVSSNLETGEAEYLRMKRCTEEIDALIASASLPYVSKPVEYRGMKLLDGGCTDRVPLAAFEAMGYERNIVVMTHPREHRVRDRDAALAPLFYRRYPKFVAAFQGSADRYEATQQLVEKREAEGRVFTIRPAAPIPVGRLTHDPAEAKKAYDLGRADAMRRAAALLRWVQRAN